jgi:hypothetical protein
MIKLFTPSLLLPFPSLLCKAVFALVLCCSTAFLAAQPDTPTGLTVQVYDHHCELHWDASAAPGLQGYRIYAQHEGEATYSFIGFVNNVKTSFIDFVGDWNKTTAYYLTAVDVLAQESIPSDTLTATTFEMTDEQMLDMVQAYTFRYFWDFAHPVSGLARERNTTSTVTTGGSGFGIMAIIVGAERGFVTYEEALLRINKIVNFLHDDTARFKGAFPHWLNGATGQVIPFSTQDNGGDLVETAFLLQGLLTAREYFSGNTAMEIAVRENITNIWETVDWNWYRKLVSNVLYWHWSPDYNFNIDLPLRGFNETHIVYLLAIASPVEAFNIPASLYHTGWAGGSYTSNNSYYGYPLEVGGFRGGPLFFSHYSYLGFDPRGIADQYTNYFNRNTYHTLINRAHCIANPFGHEGYGDNSWGLTASDDPGGYLAHEPANSTTDNGTLTPTAALSSMPFTPDLSISVMKHFYREYGDRLWGEYGFYDAFNPGANWFANSYLAIDQGPIICMIENYRTGLLWDLFMQNPEIQPALDAIGFTPDTSVVNSVKNITDFLTSEVTLSPNPASSQVTVAFSLKNTTDLTILLRNTNGQQVAVLQDATTLAAGEQRLTYQLPSLPEGLYFIQMISETEQHLSPLLLLGS